MGHKINLEKFQIRTDLAVDVISQDSKQNGVDTKVEKINDVRVTTVILNEEGSQIINKPAGTYITLEFDDITDFESKEIVKEIFSEKLKEMIEKLSIESDGIILVVGLGNEKSTPDSLGPLVVNNIIVTNHLFELGEVESGFKRVCTLTPGVMAQTGVETSDLIKATVSSINPSLVIVVDALASQAISRVNKTIQIADSGINPGSGVGNHRKPINKETLGVPVIAIGVPTVVDAVTIVADTFHYMHKHFSYTKNNITNPFHKLVPFSKVNYLKKDITIDEKDKEELLGMVGTLDEADVKQLIFEVLSPIGYNLMVTPKEVDFIMEKLSDVIGNGINKALHEEVTNL